MGREGRVYVHWVSLVALYTHRYLAIGSLYAVLCQIPFIVNTRFICNECPELEKIHCKGIYLIIVHTKSKKTSPNFPSPSFNNVHLSPVSRTTLSLTRQHPLRPSDGHVSVTFRGLGQPIRQTLSKHTELVGLF